MLEPPPPPFMEGDYRRHKPTGRVVRITESFDRTDIDFNKRRCWWATDVVTGKARWVFQTELESDVLNPMQVLACQAQ